MISEIRSNNNQEFKLKARSTALRKHLKFGLKQVEKSIVYYTSKLKENGNLKEYKNIEAREEILSKYLKKKGDFLEVIRKIKLLMKQIAMHQQEKLDLKH